MAEFNVPLQRSFNNSNVIFAGSKKMDSKVPQNSDVFGKKTIFLIRHGQTNFNKQGIIQGSGVDTDLNETGIKQAKDFYESYKHISFDAIYISTLKRTKQTIAPFVIDKIKVEALSELDEINWGIVEGKKPTPEITNNFLQTIESWKNGNLNISVKGGETPLQLYERQKQGLEKIEKNTHEKTILICMHGRAMRSFLCLLTNTELSKMDKFLHDNLCLYKLEKTDATEYKIIINNSVEHLQNINKNE